MKPSERIRQIADEVAELEAQHFTPEGSELPTWEQLCGYWKRRCEKLRAMVCEYLAAIDAEPEKDIWDTWDGKPAGGAEKTCSDAAWAAHGQHVEISLQNLREAVHQAA